MSSPDSRRTFLKEVVASAAATPLLARNAPSADVRQVDVIVVGATTAGVGAALAAGRNGMRVAVIEETPTFGGLIANGLCNTDGSAAACTGIFEEFRKKNLAYYQQHSPNDPVVKDHPKGKLGLRYEPRVAEQLFREMAAAIPAISVYYEHIVTSVTREGKRITGVVSRDLNTQHQLTFRAPITIDATHEGDLLPLAGASFRLGREPRSPEEPHAGAIFMTESGEVFGSGEGDNKLQAFAMLATIKDYGEGVDRSIPKPPNYDERNYAPEPRRDTFWNNGGALPNSKFELNENMDGTDVTEINYRYITGDRAERRRVWEAYRDYTLGYVYFRQNVMGEKHIGLADDEFPKNNNLPYTLYVREGRRLEGAVMLNERDCVRVPGFPRCPLRSDSIAVSDWKIDSHAVSRDTEGYLFLGMGDRYHISSPVQAPYGIMVPKDIDGLLVPMAVSSTHVAFQVLRLEPIRVAMGQAAGNAAALCVKRRIQPRQVPVLELQQQLLHEGQALYFYEDVVPTTPHFVAIQEMGMRGIDPGDDTFHFRPDTAATYADLARYLFHGLNLPVKMDYTDLWRIVPWKNPHFAPPKQTQHCTPSHWATYYVMTLFNMGAFSGEELETLNPDAPATRADLTAWTRAAIASKKGLLAPPVEGDGSSTFTRAELAGFTHQLLGPRRS